MNKLLDFKKFKLLCLSACTFLYSFSTLAEIISAIDVRGNDYIEDEAIKAKMSLKKGSSVNSKAVRKDILEIFEMGYFQDIKFDLQGTKLIVTVEERPRVVEIVYEGSDEFTTEDLAESTGLKLNRVINYNKIKVALEEIRKQYEGKGYYLAEIDYKLEKIEDKKKDVRLKVNIVENERVKVRKVFFLGNKHFSARELKKVMVTTEGHVFSFFTGGGIYRELAFERDISALAFYYADNGFIQAKFPKPRVTLSHDRQYIDIVMQVEEGRQFTLGDVSFEGDDLFTSEDLRAKFDMQKGAIFSAGKLQQQIVKLSDLYGDKGYAYANVVPRTNARPDSNVVDLAIRVDRGQKVYWGEITVKGNFKTHDKVLRREIPFVEGELYSSTKRKKAIEKIRRLGFFGDTVRFIPSSPKGRNDIMNIEIQVEEKPTGTLNISAGYGSATSWLLGAQVSQNNFMGRGWQLGFSMQLNDVSSTFNFSFTDPRVFDTEWLAGFNLYRNSDQVGFNPKTYDLVQTGGSITVGKEIYENLSLAGVYRLDHTEITDPLNPNAFDDPVEPGLFTDPEEDTDYFTSSITSRMTYDTRNNRLDPSGGIYASTSAEFAGLGGRPFQKFNAFFRYYRQLFWGIVYRGRVEWGQVTNFYNDEPVPDAERFSLGGVASLRGYNPNSVGNTRNVKNIRDGETTARNYVIGGKSKFLTNHELEFSLIPDANIRGVLFLDAGNATDELFSSINGQPALLSNYGWGIRWYSPLGPLRFEWGVPMVGVPDRDGNLVKETKINFVIAPTF